MLLPTRKAIGLLVIFALTTAPLAIAKDTDTPDNYSKPSGDHKYQGKTVDEWLKAIRDRDEKTMALAFDALRSLGPEAAKAVPDLMKGRTCIINAHRLATIQRANVIFVLREGQVVERGTHQELLARGGLYAMLYEIQFRRGERSETEALAKAM